MVGRAQRTLELMGIMFGVRQWRESRFDEAFAAGRYIGACRGVHPSYEQAAAAAPPTRPLGYDNEDAGEMYRDRIDRVFSSDYPMMLWLQKVFAAGARTVYDLGGHIGLAYYAYQRLVPFPQELSWTVHDVPAVMASGRREALTRDPSGRLKFSENTDAASDIDLLFTAGCLQYLQPTLADEIAKLQRKPGWLLVNLLPLHEQEAYWTVQSIGTAFCPYRIQRSATFFGELQALGYEVVDKWENPDKSCWVAFDPGHTLDRYYGAALRLRSGG